jgi:DNA invertase Pin-like site-specific DNA recombinase
MRRAYSYIRFSSKKQEKGDSVRRQKSLAEKYCEENDLILDDTLKVDDGISAFNGDNKEFGGLRNFLDRIKEGGIEKGSCLLVESLDRLSRENMWIASGLLIDIVNKDVEVISLADNRVYNKDNINDFGKAFEMLITFALANEESSKKSKRTKDTWEEKQRKARNDKTPKTAMLPWWLELDKQNHKIIIKEKEAEIVVDIFNKYCEGYGRLRLTKYLNSKYPPVVHANKRIPKAWYESSVSHVLKNEAVIGIHEYTDPIANEKIKINDYFPSVISSELWWQSKVVRKTKKSTFTGGRQPIKNIFSHLVFCDICKGPIMRASNTLKVSDTENKTVYNMVCQNGRSGKSECGSSGWPYEDVELLLLNNLELNFDKILGVDDGLIGEKENSIAMMEEELSKVNESINFLGENLKHEVSKTLVDSLISMEKKRDQITDDISSAQEQIKLLMAEKNPTDVLDVIRSLKKVIDDGINRQIINLELKRTGCKIFLDVKKKRFEIHNNDGSKKILMNDEVVLKINPDRANNILYFGKHKVIVNMDGDGGAIKGIVMEGGVVGDSFAYDGDTIIGVMVNGVLVRYRKFSS